MEKINNETIKKSFNEVEIGTTSDMILNKYQIEKNHVKKNKKARNITIISTLSALALAGSCVGIYFLANLQKPFVPVIINNKGEQAAFELFTGVQLLDNNSPSLSIKPLNKKQQSQATIDQKEFENIVNIYHNNYYAYDSLLNNGMNINYKIEQGDYQGTYNKYVYKMTIENDYYFYYNNGFEEADDEDIETNYSGELHDSTNTYKVEFSLEKNVNTNKEEVEMTIYHSTTSYIEIEYGKVINKSSYEFAYVENEEEVQKIELEIQNKNNEYRLELEVEENDNSYEYEIYQTSTNNYKMNYSEENKDISGIITYVIGNDSITYTETTYNYKISKPIQ